MTSVHARHSKSGQARADVQVQEMPVSLRCWAIRQQQDDHGRGHQQHPGELLLILPAMVIPTPDRQRIRPEDRFLRKIATKISVNAASLIR